MRTIFNLTFCWVFGLAKEKRGRVLWISGFGIGCVGVERFWSFLRVRYVLGDGAKRWNWCRVDVSMEWGDEGGALVEEETRDSYNRKLTGASLLLFSFFFFLLLLWWRRPRCQVWGASRVRKGATPPRGRQKPRAQRAVGNAKLSRKPWHWSNSSVKCSLWLTWRKWFSWPRGIAQSLRIFDWLNDWINDSHEAMWVALDRHQRAFDQLHFSAVTILLPNCVVLCKIFGVQQVLHHCRFLFLCAKVSWNYSFCRTQRRMEWNGHEHDLTF